MVFYQKSLPSDKQIIRATEADREGLLSLYKVQIGKKYCPWTQDYPSKKTIDFDLSRDALFVMKEGSMIIAAVSIDEDEKVESLACWNPKLAPARELSRLAVLPEKQGQGIAKQMLAFGMGVIKENGCKSVHFLVNKYNVKAIRAYKDFEFAVVGECHLHDQDYLCYEKEL